MRNIADYQKEILNEMTKTERKIITYYLEHGGRAKDIASVLNVSERTVYKALYLFRKKLKERGINPSELYLRSTSEQMSHIQSSNVSVTNQKYKEIEEIISKKVLPVILEEVRRVIQVELKKVLYEEDKKNIDNYKDRDIGKLVNTLLTLNDSIVELNNNIITLVSLLKKNNQPHKTYIKTQKETPVEETPSFIKGNPWIEVLRSRTLANSKY